MKKVEIQNMNKDLQSKLTSGNITEEEALMYLEMIKLEKEILKVHKYKIATPEENTRGVWTTNVRCDAKYIQITANTKQGLLLKLKEHYNITTNTLQSLYNKYLDYRSNDDDVKYKTIKEDMRIYDKYIKGKAISTKEISKLKVSDYTLFFKHLSKQGITSKNRDAVKSIINRVYDYANMFLDLNISSPLKLMDFKLFKVVPSNNKEKTFTLEERAKLNAYMDSLDSKDNYDYAIIMLSEMIARISEIKALTWDNIKSDYIWICQMVDDENVCVDYTKSKKEEGLRENPLTDRVKDILSKIPKTDCEYIFNIDGDFLNTNTFNDRLKLRCKECGITYHSSHSFRFTNISYFASIGMAIPDIQYWAGHSEMRTTLMYIKQFKRPDRNGYVNAMNNANKVDLVS